MTYFVRHFWTNSGAYVDCLVGSPARFPIHTWTCMSCWLLHVGCSLGDLSTSQPWESNSFCRASQRVVGRLVFEIISSFVCLFIYKKVMPSGVFIYIYENICATCILLDLSFMFIWIFTFKLERRWWNRSSAVLWSICVSESIAESIIPSAFADCSHNFLLYFSFFFFSFFNVM